MYRRILLTLSLLFCVVLAGCDTPNDGLVSTCTFTSDYGDTITFSVAEGRYLKLTNEMPVQVIGNNLIVMGFGQESGDLWDTYNAVIDSEPGVSNVARGMWQTYECIYYDYLEDNAHDGHEHADGELIEGTSRNGIIRVGNTLLLACSFADDTTFAVVRDSVLIGME